MSRADPNPTRRAWYARNPEAVLAKQRASYSQRREKVLARMRAYYQNVTKPRSFGIALVTTTSSASAEGSP